jgi:hypothetical protein
MSEFLALVATDNGVARVFRDNDGSAISPGKRGAARAEPITK